MATNGRRRPPRPRIEILGPAPSKPEAAAIAAAIERFLAETAPAPGAASERMSPWQRAAILEGVGARQTALSPWERIEHT